MKIHAFWILSACILFLLSLVYLHNGFHRRNALFAYWLCFGVAVQLLGAWGLAAGRPPWYDQVRIVADVGGYVLAAGVLILATIRRDCPVNRILLAGLGAMLAFNLIGRWLGHSLDHGVRIWLRNISFFGPALFLLIMLSGIRLDRLPLWVDWALRGLAGRLSDRPAVASTYKVNLDASRGPLN